MILFHHSQTINRTIESLKCLNEFNLIVACLNDMIVFPPPPEEMCHRYAVEYVTLLFLYEHFFEDEEAASSIDLERQCTPMVRIQMLKNLMTLFFSEGDKLCGRLYQKLSLLLGQKIVMDHMPLLMVCLEVNLRKNISFYRTFFLRFRNHFPTGTW